ncbi:UNVERIFIED_ORG: phosphatidylserine/phosphatidylglycerophosphate/cardiolipin synthase-like enzyme [Variovorax paradoxus]|nr:phosphatidylserine/phosphatidylglycerophosphate/cardiolipin synthase-like enzyme [Variovorax paradoxus]
MAAPVTQQKSVVPISESQRSTMGSAQWLLEKPEDAKTPVYHANNLDLFICGEDAFNQIAADLKSAKDSVDIICWGFDPAMELTRNGTRWPRGETWGGLLRDVAEGKFNGGKPVQVRLLSWYGFIGSDLLGGNNMPGYGKDADFDIRQAASRGIAGAAMPGGRKALPPPAEPTEPKDRREVFNSRWYRAVFEGKLPNLSIRTRDVSEKAVKESLRAEPGKRGMIESAGFQKVATDHQKTILIDYELNGGASAVGYVMGLNSVTDYWDTTQHLFHDPRRGEAWEGLGESLPDLKPYQDYACRIRGAALVAVSKNFTDAWNRAAGKGSKLARTHELSKPPAGLARNLDERGQRAQIVRTQPEERDKSIQRLYRQASSFARNYLYVENQYFQYTDWANQLKDARTGFVRGWQSGGRSPGDLPDLHVMVVIPTPERVQMVPRTYDTVKALGRGDSMPDQDKSVEDELKRNRQQQASWDEHVKRQAEKGEVPDPDMAPAPLSPLAQSAKDAGDKRELPRLLQSLGLRVLVGSLWTYDYAWTTAKFSVFERQRRDQQRYDEQRASYEKSQKEYNEFVKRATAVGARPFWGPMGGVPPTPPVNRKKEIDAAIAQRYREIYIHSKLLMIDDGFFTLGSANLNLRSMAVDAEINVASDDVEKTTDLRRRVWSLHSGKAEFCDGGDASPRAVKRAFDAWEQLMNDNAAKRPKGDAPTGFIFPFADSRSSWIRFG